MVQKTMLFIKLFKRESFALIYFVYGVVCNGFFSTDNMDSSIGIQTKMTILVGILEVAMRIDFMFEMDLINLR